MNVAGMKRALAEVADKTSSYPDKTLLTQIIAGLNTLPNGLEKEIDACLSKPSSRRLSSGSQSED